MLAHRPFLLGEPLNFIVPYQCRPLLLRLLILGPLVGRRHIKFRIRREQLDEKRSSMLIPIDNELLDELIN